MGSERAYELLDAMGDTGYLSYTLQMEKMRAWTGGLTEEDWTETALQHLALRLLSTYRKRPAKATPPSCNPLRWLRQAIAHRAW